MKSIIVIMTALLLVGCSMGRANHGADAICTGYKNDARHFPSPPSAFNGTTPRMPNSSMDQFYVTDSFAMVSCSGTYEFQPGNAYATGKYHAGQTIVVYITSASFEMQSPNQVNTDLRLGLYSLTETNIEPGTPGRNQYSPRAAVVSYFTYAPPFSYGEAFILNEISPLPSARDFSSQPLVLTVTIPNDAVGEYQVGAVMQFNSDGQPSDSQYQYHVQGYITVQ